MDLSILFLINISVAFFLFFLYKQHSWYSYLHVYILQFFWVGSQSTCFLTFARCWGVDQLFSKVAVSVYPSHCPASKSLIMLSAVRGFSSILCLHPRAPPHPPSREVPENTTSWHSAMQIRILWSFTTYCSDSSFLGWDISVPASPSAPA